jgi:hypothetical protein
MTLFATHPLRRQYSLFWRKPPLARAGPRTRYAFIAKGLASTVPPNNPIDLQSLKLIDFHLLRWSAQQRLFTVLGALTSMLKTSAQLRLENLALRQQLAVLRRSAPKRLKLTPADRIFWVWLRRVWSDWKSALMIVKAETVVAWHRKGFRLFWTWKIGRGKPGRPSVPPEVRDLIRMMSRNNPRWGAPRIHGELLKLGIEITEPTVAKYMVRHRKPPSQGRKSPPWPSCWIELDSRGLYSVAEFAEFPNHFHCALAH